jgi:zinc protease
MPDRSVKTVTVYVTYFVGSAQDYAGACGRAHLLEHMMFRGSANLASGEHGLWVRRVGGELQGSTGIDRSVYYETVPSADLELALYLEADRMRDLLLSVENLDNEKRSVAAEASTKSSNDLQKVRGIAASLLMHTPLPQCPVVGIPEDIGRATIEDLSWLYHEYYVPSNALLIVTGDCEPSRAFPLIDRYFGAISSSQPTRAEYISTPTNQRDQGGLVIVEQRSGKKRGIYFCTNLGIPFSKEWYASFILGRWLAEGEYSVLYQSLVRKIGYARSVRFSVQPRKGGAIGTIFIESIDGDRLNLIKEEAMRALHRVAYEPIDAATLNRLKKISEVEIQSEWASTYGKADALSQAMALYGRVYEFESTVNRLRSINTADITEMARIIGREDPVTVTSAEGR